MKSLPKATPQTHNEQFQIWNPSELSIDVAASATETQKEQVLRIFHADRGSSSSQSGKSSIPHKSGASQNFATWQPDEMSTKPSATHRAEWSFIGPSDLPYQFPQQNQGSELNGPARGQSYLDKEASTILGQARIQAEEMILAAQTEADNVLLQAQEEIEEQRKEAYQQSRDQVISEIGDALKATQALVAEVQTWKTDLTSQGERVLIEMLKEIAQKMFGEGIELDSSKLQINLNRIMENVHSLGDLNIFLNPRDAKNLDPSWSEYQMLVSGNNVKVIPSEKITRGGCYIKGIMGIVDGRVEQQLNTVLKIFEDDSELDE